MRNLSNDPYGALNDDDWWWPEVLPDDSALDPGQNLLAESQREQFLNDGFLFLNNLWPETLIAQAAQEARELFPEEKVISLSLADPSYLSFSPMPWTHKGEQSANLAINQMPLHPRALRAVAELLQSNVEDIRLYQDHLIAKVGRPRDPETVEAAHTAAGDQDIHVDYGNNTLLVPPRTSGPEVVACLCYYSDVQEAGGATHFVRAAPGELTQYSQAAFNPPNFVFGTHNGSSADDAGVRSLELTETRYREEKPLRYQPGSCVLYRLDAWHRGTPVAPHKVRYTQHHAWKQKSAEWVNWQGFAPKLAQLPTAYLENLSVVQRIVLGFAAPGDPYWTEETLDSVGLRYPGMDMTTYRTKMRRE